jgi:hypothetical protein
MQLTLLLQVHTTFGDYNRDIAVDVALPMFIEQRNSNVCIRYALDEGYTENSRLGFYV